MKNPQQFTIIISLSEEENNLLHMLAKRINAKYMNWYTDYSPNNDEMFTCFLCDEVFSLGDKMAEHGKMHLKDSNLLPFI